MSKPTALTNPSVQSRHSPQQLDSDPRTQRDNDTDQYEPLPLNLGKSQARPNEKHGFRTPSIKNGLRAYVLPNKALSRITPTCEPIRTEPRSRFMPSKSSNADCRDR